MSFPQDLPYYLTPATLVDLQARLAAIGIRASVAEMESFAVQCAEVGTTLWRLVEELERGAVEQENPELLARTRAIHDLLRAAEKQDPELN